MKVALIFSILLNGVSLFAQSHIDSPRTRESFNKGWLFARYGLQPDGSRKAEPGGVVYPIHLSASSEETGKGNLAALAMDGKPDTRWCASDSNPRQWLLLDLGQEQSIGKVAIDWEFPNLQYHHSIAASTDQKSWKPLPASARYLRINIPGVPGGKWASISEIHLFDSAGREIKNTPRILPGSPESPDFNDSIQLLNAVI